MITGIVRSIPNGRNNQPANWCFIKGDNGKEYFLHETELWDGWQALKDRIAEKKIVTIQFDVKETEKGLRAANAMIFDAPNSRS
jgi:cold shock CspA family protein